MSNEQSKLKRKTPIIVWCIRLCFFGIIFYFSKFWIENNSATLTGKIIFGGFIAVSAIVLVASFVHSKVSLGFIVVATITIPLIIFWGVDNLLKGAWWEWLLAIPAQMGIPFAVAFYMWKAPNVRNYYLPNHK